MATSTAVHPTAHHGRGGRVALCDPVRLDETDAQCARQRRRQSDGEPDEQALQHRPTRTG
jgi:hypothetical protein